MSYYYVWPGATGDNDGGGDGAAGDPTDSDNWTDAWVSLQSAVGAVTAGNTVFCRGTQTLATAINLSSIAGTNSSPIKFIGCNESTGAVDGSLFVLDGDGVATNCMVDAGTSDYLIFRYFGITGATDDGVDLEGDYGVFYDSKFYLNGGCGCDNYNGPAHFVRCLFKDNSSYGLSLYYASVCIGCAFIDNGGYGVGGYSTSTNLFFNCIFSYNSNDSFSASGSGTRFINCVFNGDGSTGSDGLDSDGSEMIIGCRFTNFDSAGAVGLDFTSETMGLIGWNYFENNTTDIASDVNNPCNHIIDESGNDTNLFDQGDTYQGYTDLTDGAEDYNLASGATLFSQGITVPMDY